MNFNISQHYSDLKADDFGINCQPTLAFLNATRQREFDVTNQAVIITAYREGLDNDAPLFMDMISASSFVNLPPIPDQIERLHTAVTVANVLSGDISLLHLRTQLNASVINELTEDSAVAVLTGAKGQVAVPATILANTEMLKVVALCVADPGVYLAFTDSPELGRTLASIRVHEGQGQQALNPFTKEYWNKV